MFGWLRKRERNEHLKMLKQNELASMYLIEFQENSIESGLSDDRGLLDILELSLFATRNYQEDMKSFRIMKPEVLDDQFTANKNLRRLFDEVMIGKRAFAKSFGSASEKLEKFDDKFRPNEGWDVYYRHFGISLEEKLKG